MEKKAKVLVMTPNMIGFEDGINRIQPCHGPGSICGRLRDRGHEVYFRDTALEGYKSTTPNDDGQTVTIGENEEATARYIGEVQPDIVAISILFSNLATHGKDIARLAKAINPNITTILGGNHVNHTYREIIRDPNVDFVIQGECDFTLEQLVSAITNNEDVSKVPGVVHMSGDQVLIGAATSRIADLDTLPKEAREIMNMEGYFALGLFHSPKSGTNKIGSVMASRGCPEECTFCTTPQMWGKTVRWRSPGIIYEEIKELQEVYGVEEIQFEDDTLTAHRLNLLELCDLIEPLGLRWCTPNGVKVNYHAKTPERQAHLFRRMFESGCYQITFAVESGDQDILDHLVKKRLPLDTVKPTIDAAKEAGMLVHTFFMVGFPGETYEQMQKTIKFAEHIEADSYSVAITTPLPGTPLFEMVKSQDLFVDDFSTDQIIYRKSLIKVPGFTPAEFESWVDQQNIYLNGLLKTRDPERAVRIYGTSTDERMLKRQT